MREILGRFGRPRTATMKNHGGPRLSMQGPPPFLSRSYYETGSDAALIKVRLAIAALTLGP